jgi:hypothetical protein
MKLVTGTKQTDATNTGAQTLQKKKKKVAKKKISAQMLNSGAGQILVTNSGLKDVEMVTKLHGMPGRRIPLGNKIENPISAHCIGKEVLTTHTMRNSDAIGI